MKIFRLMSPKGKRFGGKGLADTIFSRSMLMSGNLTGVKDLMHLLPGNEIDHSYVDYELID